LFFVGFIIIGATIDSLITLTSVKIVPTKKTQAQPPATDYLQYWFQFSADDNALILPNERKRGHQKVVDAARLRQPSLRRRRWVALPASAALVARQPRQPQRSNQRLNRPKWMVLNRCRTIEWHTPPYRLYCRRIDADGC
jgi:hypothetical protein